MDTWDLWIDDPGKEAGPLDDNIIVKLDCNGKLIGVEVVSLKKLGSGELRRLPRELYRALTDTLKKLTQTPAAELENL
ncbi:MAG: DUF2283 domain-containing protein [Candidatus Bathyarchaeia archaeon]